MPLRSYVRTYLLSRTYGLKNLLRRSFMLLLRPLGFHPLTREETIALLEPHLLNQAPGQPVLLPKVDNGDRSEMTVFREQKVFSLRVYVWSYEKPGTTITQFPYGSIAVSGGVLCTDFGHSGVYRAMLSPKKRISKHLSLLIAPWSQYVDGISFGGYYDFVFLVAAKLCRIKNALPEAEFSSAGVAYPLFNTSYERDYLELLGVQSIQLSDSRQVKIKADRVLLGNSGDWFYPNYSDILALKKQVEGVLKPERTRNDRIYISRSGRRRVLNEDELIPLLERYGFRIIEDQPFTVAEQVDIYKNAAVIIGPHGASFTNLIWCEPGTHLVELFSPNYIPRFFQYLCIMMGLNYSALYWGEKAVDQQVVRTMVEDMVVPYAQLEHFLEQHFSI